MGALRRLVPGLAAIFPLLTQAQARAKVPPTSLDKLVQTSDIIVLARVVEAWKGSPGDFVKFRASPSWACDSSDAREGEIVVLFLVAPDKKAPRLSIAHAGRGRMPVREVEGTKYATIWSEDVRLPPGTQTIDGPDANYKFIRSVLLARSRNSFTVR